MKKFLIIIMIIFLLVGGFFGYKFVKEKIKLARYAEIKKGWYVEVTEEEVNIRKEADRNSSLLTKAHKGDVFEVTDMEMHNGNNWYKIKYEKNKYGWIANPKGTEYLEDGNNPEDIAKPTIRFFETVYYVNSIDEINYNHLEVKDDREGVVVTHKVYHEVDELANKDQYWILYTATDVAGKTAQKVQKIVFNKRPDESQVYPFSELER